ncbi:MAG: type II toxin-antitoxin system VapC family toxin [Balneolaceae bacterium]|nr:MAG: type II toxin-antitoxin system VapC family toxin [Balneolaceae bacterium]
MQPSLFDTDVIIDFLRGHPDAVNFLNTFDQQFRISAVTIAELYSGVNQDAERDELAWFLSLFTVMPLTEEIAIDAGKLRQNYFRSHGMGLADAMIAATARSFGARLISLNKKHFGMLGNLVVPYEK